MALGGYAPRDEKLIRENEGKTAYELLELGLSNKAFERLSAEKESQRNAPTISEKNEHVSPNSEIKGVDRIEGESESLTPTVVEKATKPKAAKPTLSDLRTPAKSGGILTTVKVVGPTGIPQNMSANAAEKLVRRQPNKYHII